MNGGGCNGLRVFAREDLLVEVRINKFLSEAGVCSRREADRQIEAGNVTIDGRIARMGDKVEAGQTVCFQGRAVSKEEEMILIAFHKPVGIVCTAEKREKKQCDRLYRLSEAHLSGRKTG